MKKLYSLFTVLAIASLTGSAFADEPTFTITELFAPNGTEGVIYREIKYNSQIEIKLRNVTPKTFEGTFSPACLGDTFYDYSYIEMANANTSSEESNDDSFIEIKNLGEADILRVEFIAGAAGQNAKLTCAPSIDGVDYLADYETVQGKAISKSFTFEGPNGGEMKDVCNPSYFYEVPEHIIDAWGDGPEYNNFIKDAKFIRLNWGKRFAGTSGSKGGSLNLFALKVYTNADTTIVGIEEEKSDNELTISLSAGRLSVSQESVIEVFSVRGEKVTHFNATTDADLTNLEKGIYIVKAKSIDSKKTAIKKIII